MLCVAEERDACRRVGKAKKEKSLQKDAPCRTEGPAMKKAKDV